MKTAEKIGSLTYEDMRSMKTSELESWIKKGTGALNPRIDRLSKHVKKEDVALDAYKEVMKSGGKFGLSKLKYGLDTSKFDDASRYRNRLVKELSRMSDFANYKTGTIAGAREYRKHQLSLITDDVKTDDMSTQEVNDIASEAWKTYEKYKEFMLKSGSASAILDSDQVLTWYKKNINASTDESDFEDMLNRMNSELDIKIKEAEIEDKKAYEITSSKSVWKPF